MKDFRSVVNDYLKKNDRHKKQLAAVISLSVLISFTVPMILQEPAVSQTRVDIDGGDILSTQLFNVASDYMISNAAGVEGNGGQSPTQLSEVTLTIGDGVDWVTAANCQTASDVSSAARNKYFLGLASDFCIFLQNDFTPQAADSEGRVAVGGNVNFEDGGYNYQIGSGDYGTSTALGMTDNYTGITGFAHLITNGTIININTYGNSNTKDSMQNYKRLVTASSFSDCTHYNGTGGWGSGKAYANNCYHDDVPGEHIDEASQIYLGKLIDFDTEFDYIKGQSQKLSKISANGTIRPMTEEDIVQTASTWAKDDINKKTIREGFVLTGPGKDSGVKTVYFTIDSWEELHGKALQFKEIPEFYDENGNKTIANIVINVKGENITVVDDTANKVNIGFTFINGEEISNTGDNSSNNHKYSENILYNFYEAKTLRIDGNFNGTILAPNADVNSDKDCRGHLSGSLIAKSFKGGLEFGYRPYRGTVDILGSSNGYAVPFDKFIAGTNKATRLAGATFGVYEGEDLVTTFTSNGTDSEFVNLPSKVEFDGNSENEDKLITTTYTIKEISAPEGFIADPTTVYTVTIKEQIKAGVFTDTDDKEVKPSGSGAILTGRPSEVEATVEIEGNNGYTPQSFNIYIKDIWGYDENSHNDTIVRRELTVDNEIFYLDMDNGNVVSVSRNDGHSIGTGAVVQTNNDVEIGTTVSHFSTAINSMVTATEYETEVVTETTLDDDDNVILDDEGNPVTTTAVDENGNPVTQTVVNADGIPVTKIVVDDDGNAQTEVGTTVVTKVLGGDPLPEYELNIIDFEGDVSGGYELTFYYNDPSKTKTYNGNSKVKDNNIDLGDLNKSGVVGVAIKFSNAVNGNFLIQKVGQGSTGWDPILETDYGNWKQFNAGETYYFHTKDKENPASTSTSVTEEVVNLTTSIDTSTVLDTSWKTTSISTYDIYNTLDINVSSPTTYTTAVTADDGTATNKTYRFDPNAMMMMPMPTTYPSFENDYGLIFNKFSLTGETTEHLKGATINIEAVTFSGDEPSGTPVDDMSNILDGSASTTIDLSKLDNNKLYRFVESATPDDTKYETADPIYFVKSGTVIYCTTDVAKAKAYSSGTPSGWESVNITAHTDNSKPSVNMYDIKISGAKIKLQKTAENYTTKLDGATFKLYAANDDLIYPLGEDDATFTIKDGEIDLYEMLKNAAANEYNPKYVQNGYLQPGSYYLYEVTPPEGGYDAGTFGFKVNRDYTIEAVEAGTPTYITIFEGNETGQYTDKNSYENVSAIEVIATFSSGYDENISFDDNGPIKIQGNTNWVSGGITGWSNLLTNTTLGSRTVTPLGNNQYSIKYEFKDTQSLNGSLDGNIQYQHNDKVPTLNEIRIYGEEGAGSGSSASYQINDFVWNDKNSDRPDVDALILCYSDGKSIWYDSSSITPSTESSGDWNTWKTNNVNKSNVVGARLILSGEGSGKFFIQRNGDPWDEILTKGETLSAGTYDFGDVSALANCVKLESTTKEYVLSDLSSYKTGDNKWFINVSNLGLGVNEINNYVLDFTNTTKPNKVVFNDQVPKKYNNNEWPWQQYYNIGNTITQEWNGISTIQFEYEGSVDTSNVKLTVYCNSEISVTVENLPEPEPETPELAAGLAVRVDEDGTIKIPNKKSGDKITITVEKSWKDDAGFEDLRNDSIEVQLKRRTPDGDEDIDFNNSNDYKATLNSGSKWKASWSNLKRHNGDEEKPYKYYVSEVTVNDNYTNTISHDGKTKDGKESVLTSGGTIKVTNTLKTKDISVEKKWFDSDNKEIANSSSLLPAAIQVKLQYNKDGEWFDAQKEVAVDDEKTELQTYTISLTANDNWSAKIEKLPECYDYRLVEVNVPAGWTSNNNDTTAGDSTATLKNTQQVGSLEIEKFWENDTEGDRKAVTVEVYRTTESPASTAIKNIPTDSDAYDNYAKALQYSLYFYDANMCGSQVGETSAYSWRDDCHTYCTVDGGFHDAGDHTMFGLPQGFTASTLGWEYYEFKEAFDSLGQTEHYQTIMKYFCDFFVNSTELTNGSVTNFLYQKGNGGTDHNYWGSPEKQSENDFGQKEYWTTNGASDIAANYAAALAAYAVNFPNDSNSATYLTYAKALYEFSTKYNTCTSDGPSGFYWDGRTDATDEQAWAATWLYLATNGSYISADDCKTKIIAAQTYQTNQKDVDPRGHFWNNVTLGAASVYSEHISKNDTETKKIVTDYLTTNCIGDDYRIVGWGDWGSARHNTLLQTVALSATKNFDDIDYTDWCAKQMSYILGDNNGKVCLITGFAGNSVSHVHHRAASVTKSNANYAHKIIGALAGGPGSTSFANYPNDVENFQENEVALDYNAGLVGAAAGLYQLTGKGTLATEQELKDASGNELDFVYDSTPVNVTNYDPLELSVNRNEPVVLSIGDINELVLKNADGEEIKDVTWTVNNDLISVVEGVMTANRNGTVELTATYSTGSKTFDVNVQLTSINEQDYIEKIKGMSWVKDVEINKTNNSWKATVDKLPLYDNSGNVYYYYIVEKDVNGYYTVAYSGNDGVKLVNGETQNMSVTNKKYDNAGVTMPSSGGTGTRNYYVIGACLIGMAGMFWLIRRRRTIK